MEPVPSSPTASGRVCAYLRSNVLGLVAIYIALAGTAWAVEQIGAADIRPNAVRTQHIKDSHVRTNDIGDSQVVSLKVADNTLTGEDIDESTLIIPETPFPVAPFQGGSGIVPNSGVFKFAGAAVQVAVGPGQKLTGSASVAISPTEETGPFDYGLCYSAFGPAGPLTNFAGTFHTAEATLDTQTPLSASASTSVPALGVYTVGFCLRHPTSDVNAGPSSGWVILTD